MSVMDGCEERSASSIIMVPVLSYSASYMLFSPRTVLHLPDSPADRFRRYISHVSPRSSLTFSLRAVGVQRSDMDCHYSYQPFALTSFTKPLKAPIR